MIRGVAKGENMVRGASPMVRRGSGQEGTAGAGAKAVASTRSEKA
jgi:hypothetical protein